MTESNPSSSTLTSFFKDKARLSETCLIAAFITLAGLYAMLMLTDRIPLPGLIILGTLWLGYWLFSRRLSFATPMDLTIIILLGLLSLSLTNSVDIYLTLPKVYGLVLGVILFYWLVNYVRNVDRLRVVIAGLILLAFGLPLLGLLGADWSVSSYSIPKRILEALTSRFGFIERLSSGGGIHVNTIGGTLCFFVPLLLSLLFDGGTVQWASTQNKQPVRSLVILYKVVVVLALAIVLFVLFYTESRGSYLGSIIGVIALLVWKDRRFLWLIPVVLLVFILVFILFAKSDFSTFLAMLDTTQDNNTLQVRWDYWKRTIYLIQDFPITGAGLGVYNKVFQGLYLFSPFVSDLEPSFYAHNLYLGVTASMGIPALVVYFTLFGSVTSMVFSSTRKAQPLTGVVLMGLSCGFLAHLIYGIMDNYLPGEKLGVVMWIFLGIITAINIHPQGFSTCGDDQNSRINQTYWLKFPQWLTITGLGLLSWVMVSLAAVSFINEYPLLSLIIAAVGGFLSGLVLARLFCIKKAHLRVKQAAAAGT